MKIAHTIVDVPLHVERVPTYTRRQLAASGPRVAIGCAYQPRIVVTPAVHAPAPRKRARKGRWLIGAAIVSALYCAGVWL